MKIATIKTQEWEGEVRELGTDYLLIIRGPRVQRSLRVPQVLRSGRSGLDAALEEVEIAVREAVG